MRHVEVSTWRPLPDRGELIRLAFPFDAELVTALKDALRRHRDKVSLSRIRLAGGWLAEHKAWFVEPDVYPHTRLDLEAIGCTFGPPGSATPKPKVQRQNMWRGQVCPLCGRGFSPDCAPVHVPRLHCEIPECTEGKVCWNCLRSERPTLAWLIENAAFYAGQPPQNVHQLPTNSDTDRINLAAESDDTRPASAA